MAYDVRLIPIGKAGYKPVVLNADRFCMPYGTVTALCVCVCLPLYLSVFLPFSFPSLTCLSDDATFSLFTVLVCKCTQTKLWREHKKHKVQECMNSDAHTHTHMCTHTKHTHTHWRMAAIRWGNQACEDRGALRGCSLLYGTCVCVCVCVCTCYMFVCIW